MAISNEALWLLVKTEEKWWKRLDLAVAKWMNEVLTEAANVANHAERLAFVRQVPKQPRPYTHLIKWSVSGSNKVTTSNDPLDIADVTDAQLYNEVKVILSTFAVQGQVVRRDDEDPER
jgi:hypothetical protein